MQSPSFLEYPRSLEQTRGENNARTRFGTHAIPLDNQIRNLLDATPASALAPMYAYFFNALSQAGVVDAPRSVGHTLLLALDGTAYFFSPSTHCEPGSTRHANGQVTDVHVAVTPVRVKPGSDKVIALVPEFIWPQDGAQKQDGELTAAKRWLAAHGTHYSRLNTIVLGDGLYCHEPLCRALPSRGLGFILVCKPASHATVYEWVADLERRGAVHTLTRTR